MNDKEIEVARAADDEVLAGVRRRRSGVDPLVPVSPAWVAPPAGATETLRRHVRVRTLAYGLRGLAAVLVAFAIVAAVFGPFGLRGSPAAQATGSQGATGSLPPGTTEFTYAVDPVAGKLPTKAEAVQMFDLIGQRLRAAGIGNFEMGAGDALTIRIPGPVDVAAVRYLLGHPGVFEIVPLPPSVYGTSVAAGSKTVPVAGDAVDPSLPLLIADKNLLHDQVKAESTTGSWDVLFSLDAEGTAELASFSAVHVNEYIAVVLDGKVVSAPSIFGPITGGSGRISGDFTASDAMLLAAVLRNGPLAFPIHEISASNGPGSTMRDSSSSALAS